MPFVKRLIGLPGDILELKNETLFVNGRPQALDLRSPEKLDDGKPVILGTELLVDKIHPIRILPEVASPVRTFGPITVPEDQIFLMGDNRDESRDSRFFGTRPTIDLLGRAVGVMWSWNPDFVKGPRWSRIAREFVQVPPDKPI